MSAGPEDERGGEARAQALLARFLDDPNVEARVRADPADAAREHRVDEAFTARLARIEPRRVRAFRASRAHKDAVRARGRPAR